MAKRSKFGRLDLLLGLLLIALGVYTFVQPQRAFTGVFVLYCALAIASGITDLVFYAHLKSNTGNGPTVSLVSGILSVLAGLMLLLNPAFGRWLAAVVFAVWFIAHGISRLANLGAIRALAGRGAAATCAVLNVLCILLGVFLLAKPMASVLSMGYLVAAALVLHGAGGVLEAFSKLGEKERAPREE